MAMGLYLGARRALVPSLVRYFYHRRIWCSMRALALLIEELYQHRLLPSHHRVIASSHCTSVQNYETVGLEVGNISYDLFF